MHLSSPSLLVLPRISRPLLGWLVALVPLLPLQAQSNYATPYKFTTLAGAAGQYGSTDGLGAAARFIYPTGVTVDDAGNLYVCDSGNCTIRKITPGGVVTTLAGQPGSSGTVDGVGSAARFNSPAQLTINQAGYLYVADSPAQVIRGINSATRSAFLYSGTPGQSGQSNGGFDATRGVTIPVLYYYPCGVAYDRSNIHVVMYVADTYNNVIRMINGGSVTMFAGEPPGYRPGFADGTGSDARFDHPQGIAVGPSGTVYVADTGNNLIRVISPAGVVTTLAGSAAQPGSTDGIGSAARFDGPCGIAVDANGNVFVSDSNNFTIRKITPAGVVTTIAGLAQDYSGADGVGSAARFFYPMQLALDQAGNVYVADCNNCTIRKGTPVVAKDFNADRKPDILWQNMSSGVRGFWLMNGTAYASWVDLGYVSTDWRIAATADFNGDGQPDFLWENTLTGDRGFWLMNGTTYSSWVDMGIVSTDWRFVAAADFNGDGKADILMENTVTGGRGLWLMNGTTYSGWVDLGVVSTDWRFVGAADFNADGKTDILMENTVTGDRGFWLMNGTSYSSWYDMGYVTTDWHIAAVADYNSDGKTDILWENTTTGDRGFWLMNGTAYSSWVDLGYISTDWLVSP